MARARIAKDEELPKCRAIEIEVKLTSIIAYIVALTATLTRTATPTAHALPGMSVATSVTRTANSEAL